MPKIVEVPGLGQVEFPDNMDDYHIAAKIKQHLDAIPRDVTQDMSGLQKFFAGAGKAFTDIGRGTGQLLREGIEAVSPQQNLADQIRGKPAPNLADRMGLPTRSDIDKIKVQDKNLMNTGAGLAGNITGNMAAMLPAALIPGAASIGGGALIGAGTSALQPVGTEDSRGQNMAIGGAVGAALPAGVRAAKAVKAAVVDPFTEAGRTRIAANLLRKQTTNPDAAIMALENARGATPGFNPTVGQAAADDGLATLERTIKATYPQGFNDVEKSQRGALVDALRSVAKSPEDRAAAVAAREQAVQPLYAEAKGAVVPPDAEITGLLNRPSMQAAQARAAKLAAERGEVAAAGEGGPLQGSTLHDIKMGLDDAIGNPGLGGLQGAERNAALGTKEQFMQWLESQIPAYANAKSTYAGMSRPINQMDIGQELYNRFVPALADQGGVPFRSTAQNFASALRNGDKLASNVTGMQGAKLAGIMEPEQMALLEGVAKDSATRAAAETAGRGAGSDTVQKIAMSNIAAQAGIPNWIASVARVPGGWAKRFGDLAYKDADEQVRMQLANLLQNPQQAAAAMKQAGIPPSKYAEYLKAAAQATALGINQTASGQN